MSQIPEPFLADAEATSRRIAARFDLPTDSDVFGEHCVNCDAEWCLPADRATCAHKPICESCWPNGCQVCEETVEANLRRREEAASRILRAALELRTGADDLSETDMRDLGWLTRSDLRRHVGLTIEALRRVLDVLDDVDGWKSA